MSPSAWIALKALRQLGARPVLLNALYRLGLASGHFRRVEDREQRNEEQRVESGDRGGENRQLRPLFVLPEPEELLAVLGEMGKAALMAEADEIVSGRVRLFGAQPVDLQLTSPGNLAHWTEYEKRPRLLSTHYSLFSDIKFLWEPARFGWIFCLGRAYHLTRENKYSEAFWRAFENFTSANPPNLGPNWMSGQEVALRIMAFVWAGQVFNGSSGSTSGRIDALARSVMAHALRIPPTLVYARSQQNNHLLTESAGLLTAGLALPDHPKASHWCALGWKYLNAGLLAQIDSSGEYAQHSSNYHRLMLQVVLWVNAIMKDRYQWPQPTRDAIQRSVRWLLSLLDAESGQVPNLGANDGAYILPLTTCPFQDFRPVAHAAARAFLNLDQPHGPWDEMALWFGLPVQQSTLAKVQEQNLRKVNLNNRIIGKDSWATLRTVQFTTRPSHSDQLHVDLWWRGRNIAQDAGTYLYNADPPWDNSLTTALVHNTVTVDGRDQFTRAGRFLYLDWFNAYRDNCSESDPASLQCTRGWHTGYRKPGIRHERTVISYPDGHWHIRDELVPLHKGRDEEPPTYRLQWLLPDCEWQLESDQSRTRLLLMTPLGRVELRIVIDGGKTAGVDLVRAGSVVYQSGPGNSGIPLQATTRGWVSPTYGVKVPALSLAIETKSGNDVQFVSEFIFPI